MSSRARLSAVVLIDCCTRARRPDLAPAFFGQLLRTGLGVSVITFNNLLKSLCLAKRTDDALDVLLHRMPEFGCVPDVVSYSILLKSFCDNRERVGGHLNCSGGWPRRDLSAHLPCTVIDGFFKEGEIDKGCDLLNEMMQQGISPILVTYSSSIDALCKASAMDTRQRRSSDKWFLKVFARITGVSGMRRMEKSRKLEIFFDSIAMKGQEPDIVSYQIMLDGYATEGCFVDMTDLFDLMLGDGIAPDDHIFNVLIKGYAKCRMC
ncbi:hypothetical protein SETIT_8G167900v2 [Setaria italica]|uniref:Pentacotripeptide-repeat region of PRORP domain-containing protein n=1 Tax=Setaria italica TaxID=4555 RepID=A0A368S8K2_SETIT|nr:hypothetical protein SETIT_8G167900v2 [Setaria italica]